MNVKRLQKVKHPKGNVGALENRLMVEWQNKEQENAESKAQPKAPKQQKQSQKKTQNVVAKNLTFSNTRSP